MISSSKMAAAKLAIFAARVPTQQSDQAVSVLRLPLVADHLLVGEVQSATVAGATPVSGELGGAVEAPPTQTETASETS